MEKKELRKPENSNKKQVVILKRDSEGTLTIRKLSNFGDKRNITSALKKIIQEDDNSEGANYKPFIEIEGLEKWLSKE